MWLLNVVSDPPVLCSFAANCIPPYAILSHTWGADADEVTFADMMEHAESAPEKAGYAKIEGFCRKAREEGYQHGWIDSCCIDKRSSAELSEAINSMYKWYQRAEVCYVYLSDVVRPDFPDYLDEFLSSRWFKRGWTLQELIAPRRILFFTATWRLIGTKGDELGTASPSTPSSDDMKQQGNFLRCLALTTGIDIDVLKDTKTLGRMSVAKRMSWASRRETTREEDKAYSLLGLFGVSMPILYGEGLAKAFKRLQLEIIQLSPDQTIFAWRSTAPRENSGLLAASPADYSGSSDIYQHGLHGWGHTIRPFAMTNLGLFFNAPLVQGSSYGDPSRVLCSLRAWSFGSTVSAGSRVGIWLEKVSRTSSATPQEIYRRVRCDEFKFTSLSGDVGKAKDIYVLEDEQYDLLTMLLANPARDSEGRAHRWLR